IGKDNEGGFQLAVELEVTLPHLVNAEAQALADKAHRLCPYSNATHGNIDVTITVTDDRASPTPRRHLRRARSSLVARPSGGVRPAEPGRAPLAAGVTAAPPAL